MVVLPTPGGPHKMQLCGTPDFKRHPQRHARPQQVLLPNHLAQRFRAQLLSERHVGGGGLGHARYSRAALLGIQKAVVHTAP